MLATPALAGKSDLKSFQKRLAKSATQDQAKLKGSCVCQDGSLSHGQAGFLLQFRVVLPGGFNAVAIQRSLMHFNAQTDEFAGSTPCITYTALPK